MPTTGKYTVQILREWTLRVRGPANFEQEITLPPPRGRRISGERHEKIPLFTERKWLAGSRLRELLADECSISWILDPASVKIVRADGTVLRNGVDYYLDPVWGAFGRIAGSAFGEEDTVFVSYRYFPQRIDSIVVRNGRLLRKQGTVNGANPLPPERCAGEELVCNVFFDRPRRHLSDEMLFPFLESWPGSASAGSAEQLLPKTVAKLRSGEHLRILAWGDSVTACHFIREEKNRWPNRFVALLQERFPKADIELINLGWGGKAINTFQCEPPGSPYNYEEQVVNSGADLVLLEFVNDAYLTMKPEFDRIYNRVRDDFKARGMELLVFLPHPVRPDWMDLPSQKGMAKDPRPYVNYLREFVRENHYACADLSSRFLHLWKEGIPYNTLMRNNINHLDQRGCDFYAEEAAALFPER